MTNIFDKVIIAVVKGRDRGPETMFTWEERIELFRDAVSHMSQVEVKGYDNLTVDFARQHGAVSIVRGIRAVTDFEYEFSQAMMNRKMAPELESVYLMANQEFLYLSSSRIREVSRFGYDISDLVPPNVGAAIRAKLGR